MENIYGNYDADGNLQGIYRNSGDVAPLVGGLGNLQECCCDVTCKDLCRWAINERADALSSEARLDSTFDTTLDDYKERLQWIVRAQWPIGDVDYDNMPFQGFLQDQSYMGGGFDAPAFCPSDYGSGAADFCELYELIKPLTKCVIYCGSGWNDADDTKHEYGAVEWLLKADPEDSYYGDSAENDYDPTDSSTEVLWSTLKTKVDNLATVQENVTITDEHQYDEEWFDTRLLMLDKYNKDDYGNKTASQYVRHKQTRCTRYKAHIPTVNDGVSRKNYFFVRADIRKEADEDNTGWEWDSEEDRFWYPRSLSDKLTILEFSLYKETDTQTSGDPEVILGDTTWPPLWPSASESCIDTIDHNEEDYWEYVYKSFLLPEWDGWHGIFVMSDFDFEY